MRLRARPSITPGFWAATPPPTLDRTWFQPSSKHIGACLYTTHLVTTLRSASSSIPLGSTVPSPYERRATFSTAASWLDLVVLFHLGFGIELKVLDRAHAQRPAVNRPDICSVASAVRSAPSLHVSCRRRLQEGETPKHLKYSSRRSALTPASNAVHLICSATALAISEDRV